jgi:acetyl esterase/lipase
MPFRRSLLLLLLASGAVLPCPLSAQLPEAAAWTAHVRTEYRLFTDIVYHRAGGHESRLNIYRLRAAGDPRPTLVYFHGGGWFLGSPEHAVLEVLPFLEMGWTVVTVGYRLSPVANAPAAVEDGLCALRWVVRNSDQYMVDTTRIVLSGASAGGHLALTTGMIPPDAGLGHGCLADQAFRVAAIINWFGITDVGDLLDGPNRQDYAVLWLGTQPDRMAVARRVSPLTYVRSGLPPILSIHGTEDVTVPYAHATRLHEALSEHRVENRLLSVPDGGHGNFSREEDVMIHSAIRAFLESHGILPGSTCSNGRGTESSCP